MLGETDHSDARAALEDVLADNLVAGKPLAILVNKAEAGRRGRLSERDMAKVLRGLGAPHDRHVGPCAAFAVSAHAGSGLGAPMAWMTATIALHYATLKRRVTEDTARQDARRAREKAERKARLQAQRAAFNAKEASAAAAAGSS